MKAPDEFDDGVFQKLVLGEAAQRSAARLRAELREGTTRIVRTRRRVRRIATAAGFLMCYAAGMLTMHFLGQQPAVGENRRPAFVADEESSSTQPAAQRKTTQPRIHQPVERPVQVPASIARVEPDLPTPRSAQSDFASTRQPSEIRKSRYEALRELGDVYLLERQDPEGALRAYRLALRSATPIERTLAHNEGTWLFRALTRDYETENSDERHDG